MSALQMMIDLKAINKSEIARRTGYSRQYVLYLLKGERKNKKALERVLAEIMRIAA